MKLNWSIGSNEEGEPTEMEVAKTLDDFIAMVGLNAQDEPTGYVICRQNQMWQGAPVLWSQLGTTEIEVYRLSLAEPIRTITMADREE